MRVHEIIINLGEYERVVELATKNLAALPANQVPVGWSEMFPVKSEMLPTLPTAVLDRYGLILSLAQLGRFHEGAG